MTANEIFDAFCPKFEEFLEKQICTTNDMYSSVINAARYSLLSGGKRIRPLIMTEFYKISGGKGDAVYYFAAALEMIHTYSLIHDDLPCMDNDDMRRGKPSCHKAFGEDTALLAGDGLLTEAFNVASKTPEIPCDRVLKAIAVLSQMAGINGMIAGQVMDLSFEVNTPNGDQLKAMYIKKTGCLLMAAAKIGCILAGADEEYIKTAEDYALNLGLAFQIIDDILDCTATAEVLGKPVGSDDKNGKTTFVSIYGTQKAKELAAEFTTAALAALEKFYGDKTNLKELTVYLLDRKY